MRDFTYAALRVDCILDAPECDCLPFHAAPSVAAQLIEAPRAV